MSSSEDEAAAAPARDDSSDYDDYGAAPASDDGSGASGSEGSDDGVDPARAAAASKDLERALRRARKAAEKKAKAGVVYVGRVPPGMTPASLKRELAEHGEVTKLYLQKEDKSVHRKRQRAARAHSGGRSRARGRYTEGWVEFASRKVAKRVTEALHGTRIGATKHATHADDLWSLKFLRKFTWEHLTEKMAYERKVEEVHQAIARDTRHHTEDGPAITPEQEKLLLGVELRHDQCGIVN